MKIFVGGIAFKLVNNPIIMCHKGTVKVALHAKSVRKQLQIPVCTALSLEAALFVLRLKAKIISKPLKRNLKGQ